MEPDSEGNQIGRRITRSTSLLSTNSSAPSAPATPVQGLGLSRGKKLACKATRNEKYEKRRTKLPQVEEDDDSENGNIKFTF